MMGSTNVANIKYQVEGTVLVSVRIFVNKINTYRLKR